MNKTLKLVSTLLVMVGCYQGYCSQAIAGTKSGANQLEKKGVQEDFQNNPAFIAWCMINERYPDCNPLESRNPRKFSRTLGHGH
ncbi:hypothetical protein [Bartonella rattimassiliensis]|uniref:Uncharacterized protein n=1 Tax=Bartonella rattimassiliensis 15908 TaxID=1094556 RepID=J0ZI15_9HYPH|nr:hypothetical protein [Bartonella rattimassiliensis]EJF87838.1 hypothetical protein MCY_00041 [Bartonella rattimassiliensis 15908]